MLNMTKSFKDYPQSTLDSIWQSFINAVNSILEGKGDIDSTLPHKGQEASENRG